MPTRIASSAMAGIPDKVVDFFLQVNLNNYFPKDVYETQLSGIVFFSKVNQNSPHYLMQTLNIPTL